jgi:L-ascorbate metabolism protein UlaG (beta-lactamase superfamily)
MKFNTPLIAKLTSLLAAMFLVITSLISINSKYYFGPKSDHFDGTRFFNPGKPRPHSFWDFLKWQMTASPRLWPDYVKNEFDDIPPSLVKGSELRVSWIGHVTFLLQTHGLNIITDPVYSERASPFSWAGPKRVHLPGIKLKNLPKIDIILISHNHYDHLDLATIQALWNRDHPRIIVPLGNDRIIKDFDNSIEVEAYDWGDTTPINQEVEVTLEPMHHWSARGVFDKDKALWAAFVVKTPSGNIYFVGDAGYGQGDNFTSLINKYKTFRLTLLPLGAFDPRWLMEYNHMNPQEAIQAWQLLNQPYAIPSHYLTFQLTDDGYDEAYNIFIAQAKKEKIDLNIFKPLKIGEHWFVPLK